MAYFRVQTVRNIPLVIPDPCHDPYVKGLVNTFTDARGLQVTLNWDALERLTNSVFPNGTVTLAYNKLDLATFTDRLNNNYNFTYNAIRQSTQAVDPLTRTNIYNYCDCGSLASMTDPLNRTTSFFYDKTGRRTSIRAATRSPTSTARSDA